MAASEATSFKPHVLKAEFHAYPVADILQCLMQLDLVIVNDCTEDSTAANLQIPLPLGATVCRFEQQRDGLWFPAVPVEVKTLDKGREEALTSQVLENGFSIDITALAFKQPVKCRLWFRQAGPFHPFDYELPLFDDDTVVSLNCPPSMQFDDHFGDADDAFDTQVQAQDGIDGLDEFDKEFDQLLEGAQMPGVEDKAAEDKAALKEPRNQACYGDCFGKRHFACHIPHVATGEKIMLQRIAVVEDSLGGDSFQSCPDHHLNSMQIPIASDGMWICGTLGSVTKIVAEVAIGEVNREFSFDFRVAVDVGPDTASLLGWLYASQFYATAERDSSAQRLDLYAVRERLAMQYGFCSPDASLKMLYEPEQFLDNKVSCPTDHPAHTSWKEKAM